MIRWMDWRIYSHKNLELVPNSLQGATSAELRSASPPAYHTCFIHQEVFKAWNLFFRENVDPQLIVTCRNLFKKIQYLLLYEKLS